MDEATHHTSVPPAPWLVPLALVGGIVSALSMHWPLYTGIVIAYVVTSFYARWLGHAWGSIARATVQGCSVIWKVCAMLLLIGTVVALWVKTGTIPYMMELGAAFVHPADLLWVSFLLAAVLSLVIGSCIATWSIIGPPLMALAPPELAPWLAGALVSGGMVGDRASPMSASIALLGAAAQVPPERTLTQMLRTTPLPLVLTLAAFLAANTFTHHDAAAVTSPLVNAAHGPAVALALPAIVTLLAVLRIPLLYNLLVAIVLSVVWALVMHVPGSELVRAVWGGAQLVGARRGAVVGGVLSMLNPVLLVAAAGAFQGVSSLAGSLEALTRKWYARLHNPWSFLAAAYITCFGFACLVGSQMLTIFMSGAMLRPEFTSRGWSSNALTQVLGDAAELLPAIIPWNLIGLQADAILRVPTWAMAPFAWYVYLTLGVSVGLAVRRTVRQRSVGHDP